MQQEASAEASTQTSSSHSNKVQAGFDERGIIVSDLRPVTLADLSDLVVASEAPPEPAPVDADTGSVTND